jgi:shikimate dehydrogenase
MFRAGVVGSPVAHSLSPLLHQVAFDYLDVRGESRRFDVGFDDVTGLLQALERDALSVTTPLKEVVGRYCTMSETSKRVGAVNSVRRVGDHLEGENFDGEGFHRAIMHELDVDVRNELICVYGAGPAARAIVDALLRHGAGGIEVVVRRDISLEALERDGRVRVTQTPTIAADVVVNATSVGFHEGPSSLPPVPTFDHTAFIDVVYAPAETNWMSEMRANSNRVANGLQMLIWQAKLQLEWWFDREIPVSILQDAIRA